MGHSLTRFASLVCLLVLVGAAAAQSTSAHFQTPAEAGLESINAPGGGGIFYGELVKDTTLQAGMVTLSTRAACQVWRAAASGPVLPDNREQLDGRVLHSECA